MIDGKYAAIKGIIYTNCDFLVCVEDLMGVSKHNSVIMKRLSNFKADKYIRIL